MLKRRGQWIVDGGWWMAEDSGGREKWGQVLRFPHES